MVMRKDILALSLLAFAIALESCSCFQTVTLLPGLCGRTSGVSDGELIMSTSQLAGDDDDLNYTQPVVDCRYTMTSLSASEQISFGFGTGYGEQNAVIHDLGCQGANVSLLDSDGTPIVSATCGNLSRGLYTSSGSSMTLVVNSAGGVGTLIGFRAHFTSFYIDANCSDTPGKFACSNGRCVDPSGKCDGTLINNCGDFSDNQAGPPSNCTTETTTAPATTTVATSTQQADASWLAYAIVGGLLAGLLAYWKLIRVKYLVWPCFKYPAMIYNKCCRSCCNPCCKGPCRGKPSLSSSAAAGKNGGKLLDGKWGDGNGMKGQKYDSSTFKCDIKLKKKDSSFERHNKVSDWGKPRPPPPPPPPHLGGIRREAHLGFGDDVITQPLRHDDVRQHPGFMRRGEKHIFSLNVVD